MSHSNFPWESLKAETLRLISRELGYKQVLRRDDMIAFFQSVEELGLESALETHNNADSSEDREPTVTVSAPVKRKSSRLVVEDTSEYNTRFRANKRGRLSDVGPIRRKYTTKARTTKAAASDAPKRPRGRPRKSAPVPTTQGNSDVENTPAGKKKEIFDGVVLPPRSRRTSRRGKGTEEDADMQHASKSVDEELKGSNKENESFFGTEHPAANGPSERGEADAEGEDVLLEDVQDVLS